MTSLKPCIRKFGPDRWVCGMNDLNDYEAETIQEAWLGWAYAVGQVVIWFSYDTETVH